MNAQHETLGGFEQRLLTELRRVVEAGAAPAPTQPVAPERRSLLRRPLALAGGVAAAAAAALVAVFGIGGGGESDAWAVTSNDDGTVTVEINALSDADGLERKLGAAGVPAVVEYERAAAACAAAHSGATAGAPVRKNGAVIEERSLRQAPPGASDYGLNRAGQPPASASGKGSPQPPDEGVMGLRMNGDGGVEFTLSKDVPDDTSLVIATRAPDAAGPIVGGSGISVLYAEGEIQGCKFDAPR